MALILHSYGVVKCSNFINSFGPQTSFWSRLSPVRPGGFRIDEGRTSQWDRADLRLSPASIAAAYLGRSLATELLVCRASTSCKSYHLCPQSKFPGFVVQTSRVRRCSQIAATLSSIYMSPNTPSFSRQSPHISISVGRIAGRGGPCPGV